MKASRGGALAKEKEDNYDINLMLIYYKLMKRVVEVDMLSFTVSLSQIQSFQLFFLSFSVSLRFF